MVYTVGRALEVVRHAGYGTTGLPARDYVNEAGWRLLSMRTWAWAQIPPVQLSVRVPQSFTGATWTASTKVLAGTSIAQGYTHYPGDTLTITDGGSGADLRDVVIEEKLNDNGVRLKESISDSNETGIGVTINANRAVPLPSDYGGHIRAVSPTQGRTTSFRFVTQQELLQLRAVQTVPVVGSYSGAVFAAENLKVGGGAQQHRIELWPYPTTGAPNFLTVSYSVGWRPREKDSDILSIPVWIEPLYTEILREVTKGYESEESGSVGERMAQIRTGATFFDAKAHDALAQPGFGYTGRGGAEQVGSWSDMSWWSGQGTVADLP